LLGRLQVRVIGKPRHVRNQRTNPISAAIIPEIRKADVVHCHQLHVLTNSLSAFVGRLTRKRVFVSDLGGGGWDISAYLSTDRWYRGHLHISQYSRTISGHADNPRAHVIYGGVDTEKFSPTGEPSAKSKAQRGLAIGERKSDVRGQESEVGHQKAENGHTGKVLFVGRLLPHKGIDYLIRGLPVDMCLEIIGQPYDLAYKLELEGLSDGKSVRFRHECDDTDLVKSYREAMCVVLPSVYKDSRGQETRVPELLGQTLLEGMACGVPVICTNVASMPEVVEDGVTGFVVTPNDPVALNQKLTWLREHPAEARAMGAAGRRRVLEKFTWPMVVRKCLEIYRSS
jgi:glycosyltransferase involved in cell wall biosynthesis